MFLPSGVGSSSGARPPDPANGEREFILSFLFCSVYLAFGYIKEDLTALCSYHQVEQGHRREQDHQFQLIVRVNLY